MAHGIEQHLVVQMGDNKILVVDDEHINRSVLAKILRTSGYDVSIAHDGFDALLKVMEHNPQLIVSDLQMPRMSGFELLSVVRRRFPEIAVISMSGAFDATILPPCVICDAFFAKGAYKTPELLAKVAELLLGEHRAALVPCIPPHSKQVRECLSHGLPINDGDRGRERNALRTNPDAVLGETAAVNASVAHHGLDTLGFQRLARRVFVEESYLIDDRGSDKACVLIHLGTCFETQATRDAPREWIHRFLRGRLHSRSGPQVIGTVNGYPCFYAFQVFKQYAAIDSEVSHDRELRQWFQPDRMLELVNER
jgi:CheY-like chemotaxis protein